MNKRLYTKLRKLYDEFLRLAHFPKSRMTSKWMEETLKPYLVQLQECFDISCKDPVVIKKLERLHGVKMSTMEHEFLADQLSDRKMFCTTDVDR